MALQGFRSFLGRGLSGVEGLDEEILKNLEKIEGITLSRPAVVLYVAHGLIDETPSTNYGIFILSTDFAGNNHVTGFFPPQGGETAAVAAMDTVVWTCRALGKDEPQRFAFDFQGKQ